MTRRIEHIGHSCLSGAHLAMSLAETAAGHGCLAALLGLVAGVYFGMALAAEAALRR